MNALHDAALIASLFAVDPHGTGGVCLRSPPQSARDEWLRLIRQLLPPDAALRRMPVNISDARLLGGLDLAATIRANRPIAEQGLLSLAHGGVLVVAMAERLSASTAANLCRALDRAEVAVARDGITISAAAQIGIVALDEGKSEDEGIPESLLDRMAFLIDLNEVGAREMIAPLHDRDEVMAARLILPRVELDGRWLSALCATALQLGAGSLRVTMLAVTVARIAAALDGRVHLTEEDVVLAGRLVLAPRATILSAPESSSENSSAPDEQPAPPPVEPPDTDNELDRNAMPEEQDMQDQVLAATQAAIPHGLLAKLRSPLTQDRSSRGATGRMGALRQGAINGRPAGVRAGQGRGSRLNVTETLRAAAPWQRLRGRTHSAAGRVRVTPEDFRFTCYKQRSQTLTIFAVDASGSSALNRLAETKGAVELLLADCYIRRDQVAVIAFRGRAAQVLLPPTRSLVRAKRSLAALPGGGGTPLAAALSCSVVMAAQARQRGDTVTLVMLTDGRANVARNGDLGREVGHADAMNAARIFRSAKIRALFVDSSRRPQEPAQELAATMGAMYIPLPFADARSLSKIVATTTLRDSHGRTNAKAF